MSKLIFVAPLSAISRRTRLLKVSNYMHASGFDIEHIGWERLPDEAKEHHLKYPVTKSVILKGGGYGSKFTRLLYFVWMVVVFLRALFIKKEVQVWALGFESAFPCVLASKLRGFKVYFDDADRFSMVFGFPSVIKSIIESLEEWTSIHCHVHIIPGKARYSFSSPKFFELLNFPSETEVNAAKQLYTDRSWPRKNVVVNVNGWLGAGRGMGTILKVATNLQADSVLIILAGKLDCKEAHELVTLPNALYIGEVSNAEAIASYFASDLVFTYYDPKTRINRLAQSNKWGDAIMTGIGVVVNQEVLTAKDLERNGLGISFEYEDTEGLTQWLRNASLDSSVVSRLKEAARAYAEHFGYFEDQLDKLMGK